MTLVEQAELDEPGISDADLEALALAADVDTPVAADAKPLDEVLAGDDDARLLPGWYMPTPLRRSVLIHGWKRWAIFGLIVVFVVIDAYGLCFTYGHIEAA